MLYKEIIMRDDDKKKGEQVRWGEFARVLQASMNKRFGPFWHVLVGSHIGFACKKRDQTMGVWRIGTLSIVIWKSPGVEPLEEPEAKDGKEAKGEKEGTAKAKTGPPFKVLQPEKLEEGSDEAKAVAALQEELARHSSDDIQALAQTLRKRLTKELGTIWHVAVGNEFAVEAAADCRNMTVVTSGKLRVVCFQHEQSAKWTVNWERLAKATPYGFAVMFGLAYMTLSVACEEDPEKKKTAFQMYVNRKFCRAGWEQDMGYLGACAVVGLMITSRWKSFFGSSSAFGAGARAKQD